MKGYPNLLCPRWPFFPPLYPHHFCGHPPAAPPPNTIPSVSRERMWVFWLLSQITNTGFYTYASLQNHLSIKIPCEKVLHWWTFPPRKHCDQSIQVMRPNQQQNDKIYPWFFLICIIFIIPLVLNQSEFRCWMIQAGWPRKSLLSYTRIQTVTFHEPSGPGIWTDATERMQDFSRVKKTSLLSKLWEVRDHA